MRQIATCILVLLAISVCALALFSRHESISWMPYVSGQRSCRIGFYSTDLCVIWIEQKKGNPSFGVTDVFNLWPLPVHVTHSEWLMAQQGARRLNTSLSSNGSSPLLNLLAGLGGISAPPVPRADDAGMT